MKIKASPCSEGAEFGYQRPAENVHYYLFLFPPTAKTFGGEGDGGWGEPPSPPAGVKIKAKPCPPLHRHPLFSMKWCLVLPHSTKKLLPAILPAAWRVSNKVMDARANVVECIARQDKAHTWHRVSARVVCRRAVRDLRAGAFLGSSRCTFCIAAATRRPVAQHCSRSCKWAMEWCVMEMAFWA